MFFKRVKDARYFLKTGYGTLRHLHHIVPCRKWTMPVGTWINGYTIVMR